MNIDRKFINLKVLSKLQINEKLNTRSSNIFQIERGDMLSYVPVLRIIRNESRFDAVNNIRELVDESIHIIETEEEYKVRFVQHLVEAKAGLVNLLKTYQEDQQFISSIELVIEKIDLVARKYPEACTSQTLLLEN